MKSTTLALLTAIIGCCTGTVYAQNWSQTSAPTTNWQSIASSADGTKLIAATGGFLSIGPIYLSTNSGVSWIQSSAPVTNWLRVCASADGSKLVAAGDSIFYSTNSGTTWLPANAPFPFEFWSSLASSADGTRLAAGEVGGSFPQARGVYLSTNSGASWYPAGVNGSAVSLSADGTKLVAIQYNASTPFLQLSTNGGVTWKSNYVAHSRPWWPMAVSADGARLVAAVGGFFVNTKGAVFTSTNFGLTWTTNTPIGLPVENWTSLASSADGSKLMASVLNGGLYTSVDSGVTWVSNNVPPADWQSVAISADGSKLFAAAFGGGIWTLQTQASPSMNIKTATSNIVISWLKPSIAFVLQQNTDLTAVNWIEVTNAPVFNVTNLQNQVTLPISASNALYRLTTP
ncbi:MAG TPA: sialidase family protein [Verrucomicrobiae bacterium]|nr:sialidase family protein [Verrucomicrobiae bacterium]